MNLPRLLPLLAALAAALPAAPETLFDGATFNPADPEAYAKSFAVKSLKG